MPIACSTLNPPNVISEMPLVTLLAPHRQYLRNKEQSIADQPQTKNHRHDLFHSLPFLAGLSPESLRIASPGLGRLFFAASRCGVRLQRS